MNLIFILYLLNDEDIYVLHLIKDIFDLNGKIEEYIFSPFSLLFIKMNGHMIRRFNDRQYIYANFYYYPYARYLRCENVLPYLIILNIDLIKLTKQLINMHAQVFINIVLFTNINPNKYIHHF